MCWRTLHNSGPTITADHLASIARIKVHNLGLYQSPRIDANDPALSKSADVLGFWIKTLNGLTSGLLRGFLCKKTYGRMEEEVPKGNKRRADMEDKCCFLAHIDLPVRFSNDEFVVASERIFRIFLR
jgi:hypothetical protein